MAKTRAQKQKLFDMYKKFLDEANFVIVEVNRVPASVLSNYKKELEEINAEFHIIKNRVFMKAASNHEVFKGVELTGQLAVLYGGDDIVTALKKLKEHVKKTKDFLFTKGVDEDYLKEYKPFTYKVGLLESQLLDSANIEMLATLPSKDMLLGQLVGTMSAVITGFMNVVNGNTRKLIYALNDLKAKKE